MGTKRMVGYIPGEYCWRPVEAAGFTFIHCIISGFKRCHKGKGYGALLLEACLSDAKKENAYGVAVVARKGSFMVGRRFFLKHGFEVVDTAPPDFAVLVKKLRKTPSVPKFKANWDERIESYGKGLTIIRADQCPYSVKNVKEISETALESFGLRPNIITLENYKDAQNSPCAFGTFCMLFNGKLIADHPISNRRFMNIMQNISP